MMYLTLRPTMLLSEDVSAIYLGINILCLEGNCHLFSKTCVITLLRWKVVWRLSLCMFYVLSYLYVQILI